MNNKVLAILLFGSYLAVLIEPWQLPADCFRSKKLNYLQIYLDFRPQKVKMSKQEQLTFVNLVVAIFIDHKLFDLCIFLSQICLKKTKTKIKHKIQLKYHFIKFIF